MRFSLQYKLLAAFLTVIALTLAGVAVGGSVLIRDYFIARQQRELTAKAHEVARMAKLYDDGDITYTQLNDFVNNADSLLDARVWIVDNKLNFITVSAERPGKQGGRAPSLIKPNPMDACMMGRGGKMGRGAHHRPSGGGRGFDVGPSVPPAPDGGVCMADLPGMKEIMHTIRRNEGHDWIRAYYHPYYEENMLIAAAPLVLADGRDGGTVMVNAPLSEIDSFLRHVYLYIAVSGLAAALFAVLAAAYLSRGIVRPLRAMQAAAAAMARGDYARRVRADSRDEVGDLGRSLNLLAGDLGEYVRNMERTDQLRKDFVANVAHELRTPLTIMYGYNQALQDGTVTEPEQVDRYHKVMGDEMLRLEKLIAALLELSRLQNSAVIAEPEPVDLGEVVDNVIGLLKPQSTAQEIALTTRIEPDAPAVAGDGDYLTQLVLILLDNALKFTPAGGRIWAEVKNENGAAVLVIGDTGAGIAAQDIPNIWERFYRADKSRTGGSGLGLAIARQIIDLHGAAVALESARGEGTVFTIRFAAAQRGDLKK